MCTKVFGPRQGAERLSTALWVLPPGHSAGHSRKQGTRSLPLQHPERMKRHFSGMDTEQTNCACPPQVLFTAANTFLCRSLQLRKRLGYRSTCSNGWLRAFAGNSLQQSLKAVLALVLSKDFFTRCVVFSNHIPHLSAFLQDCKTHT